MSPELIQQAWQLLVLVLQGIGITSLLGMLAFLVAYYALPPNLSVVEVKDKNKNHNFESRLIIKNLGNLPAFNIVADIYEMNFVIGGINMNNITAIDCGSKVTRLSHSEEMELPVVPHVSIPAGMNLSSCDYTLLLKYDFKLPFYSKQLSKSWRIELRNLPAGFAWQTLLK